MPSISFPYNGGRPLIPADVKVGRDQATALVDAGRPVPRQMAGLFYLDSGADTTVIDRSFVTNLNLLYIGADKVTTAMSGSRPQPCDVHRAGIEVNGPAGTGFAYDIHDLDLVVGDLRGRGYVGLLGLDVMKGLRITLDGISQQVTLYY